jgi:hypothetical protein
MHLDELRGTIFRYGEFRTAERVGLPIPTPEVRRVEVDMDRRQEEKCANYVSQIEEALENLSSPGRRGAFSSLSEGEFGGPPEGELKLAMLASIAQGG